MIKSIEEEFVKKFIVKEKRNRIISELFNSNKRFDAMTRFSHSVIDILNQNLIISNNANITVEGVIDIIKQQGITKSKAYVITDNINGEMINVQEGLNECFKSLGPAIFIMDNFCLIKEEFEYKSPLKYILCKSI